jgi:hypothetical protein
MPDDDERHAKTLALPFTKTSSTRHRFYAYSAANLRADQKYFPSVPAYSDSGLEPTVVVANENSHLIDVLCNGAQRSFEGRSLFDRLMSID